MNELVQILKYPPASDDRRVTYDPSWSPAGSCWRCPSCCMARRGTDAASDPNLKKLFDIGVAGLTLMVPFSPPTSATPFLTAPRWPLRHRRLGGNSFGAGFFGALIAGMIGGRWSIT